MDEHGANKDVNPDRPNFSLGQSETVRAVGVTRILFVLLLRKRRLNVRPPVSVFVAFPVRLSSDRVIRVPWKHFLVLFIQSIYKIGF